ncbi:MAG: HD domain-containing protein [Candidatus Pacebacteria bacterium]|nr:HD domain-containing protein [Candidatus Paceibacterota bacterium]
MKYEDRVYGECEITEAVVLDLIGSSSLQRLKGIDQSGYRALWVQPETELGEYDNSRFAHSVGVYLLLKKYGAPLEEQLAGLIHDVSHTAFSHCIDYVLNVGSEAKQDHQDNVFEAFVRKSEIPNILEKHGQNVDRLLDDGNFPLKENILPDLCADRIDYSMRTAVLFGEIDFKQAQEILDGLAVKDNIWFFRDFESAKRYAELFSRVNDIHYAGLDSARMYEAVRGFVVYAMAKDYIYEEYLYRGDEAVIAKINEHLEEDVELQKLFDRMNDKSKISESVVGYDAEVVCKSRIVDPWFSDSGILRRVSDADSSWGKVVREKLKPKRYFLKYKN